MESRNAELEDSTTISGAGFLLKVGSTSNHLDLGTAGAVCLGVSVDESSKDAEGVYETASATISFTPLGGVIMCQATDGQSLVRGAQIYAGANGLATTSNANSAKKLGLYVGDGMTAASGDMIPVNTMGAEQA